MYRTVMEFVPPVSVPSTLPHQAQTQTKVAIITGASSGIGRTTSIALCAAGWRVVLSARREAELKETARLCEAAAREAGIQSSAETPGISDGSELSDIQNSSGQLALTVPGDVTLEEDVNNLFDTAAAVYGRIDLLFNNAGISGPGVPIQEMKLADFQSVIAINVTAAFLCTQAALRQFASQVPQGGRIINNGSLAAHVPRPLSSAYSISKHAVWGLTKSTSLEGRKYGVAVTQIDVGNAMTEMALGHATAGALQPDGSTKVEPTIDAKHVASSIVHIASLPLNVTVLQMNVMATEMPYVGRG